MGVQCNPTQIQDAGCKGDSQEGSQSCPSCEENCQDKEGFQEGRKEGHRQKSQEGCAKEKGISRLISFCKTVSKLLPREERRNETQKVDRASSGLIKYK